MTEEKLKYAIIDLENKCGYDSLGHAVTEVFRKQVAAMFSLAVESAVEDFSYKLLRTEDYKPSIKHLVNNAVKEALESNRFSFKQDLTVLANRNKTQSEKLENYGQIASTILEMLKEVSISGDPEKISYIVNAIQEIAKEHNNG